MTTPASSGRSASGPSAPALSLRQVDKSFQTRTATISVLADCSLEVARGEQVALLGASGSGKSTLLAIAGALLAPDRGSVKVCNEDLFAMPRSRRGRRRAALIGFVFQRFHLLPYLTVEENVLTATVAAEIPGLRGTPAARDRAREVLSQLGMESRLSHRPHQLSVGERQRCAMARAMICNPGLILADEPTGNLDPIAAQSVLSALRTAANGGAGVLIVTHDPSVAAATDRSLHLEQGRIRAPEGVTS